ncbi:hypothetical protein EU528_06975, partial [Candidatus Thorarchaeota archaeon]
TISWHPSDSYPYSYIVYLDDVEYESDFWDGETITINVDGLIPGDYTFTIFVYDQAGLYISSTVIQTVIDSTPPNLVIEGIAEDEVFSGIIDITALVTDFSPIHRVEFYIDWELVTTDYETSYLFSFDTTLLTDGEHILTVKAYDIFENEQMLQSRFYVDNSPPELINFDQTFYNGIPGWELAVTVTITDDNPISSVELVIHSTEGYYLQISMTNIGSGEFDTIWTTPDYLIGEFTIDVVASDSLGNIGTYSVVGWAHLYDYLKLTATRAEVELVDDWGATLNRSWNDYYDTYGLPMAYFTDDGTQVELLLLNPTTEMYYITATHLDAPDYALHVIATSNGLVVYDESYVDNPITSGDIHKYLVRYSESFTEIRNNDFDDNDISEWTVTRGSFVATAG